METNPELPTRSRRKVILAFVAVFFLGGLAGAAVGHVVEARRAIDIFDASSQGSRHGVFLWSLERKLKLTATQRAEIEVILAQYDRDVATMMVPVDPQARALRRQMRADVRARLAPEQQGRYDELMALWDKAKGRTPDTATTSAAATTLPSVAPPP